MYKKKFYYWPLLCLVIFGFMFYTKGMKSTHVDGPYISWTSKNEVVFTYIGYDTVRVMKQPVDAGTGKVVVKGLLSDHDVAYPLQRTYQPDKELDFKAPRVLYLGSIYGEYEGLVAFLRTHGVIDDANRWTWGNGHVVFTGNVFGHGTEVTKCLWLIHELESAAAAADGKVHLLLGEQEFKNLQGNVGSLNPTLYRLYKQLDLDYQQLYGPATVQGQWLRSRSAVIKINNNLVSYGGVSPDLAARGLDLGRINAMVRQRVNNPEGEADTTVQLVAGSKGPLLFTGFINEGVDNDQLIETKLADVLKQYGASAMVIASTGSKAVRSVFGGKLFAIDVPMNKTDVTLEGLFEEGGTYYRLTTAGEKIKI